LFSNREVICEAGSILVGPPKFAKRSGYGWKPVGFGGSTATSKSDPPAAGYASNEVAPNKSLKAI